MTDISKLSVEYIKTEDLIPYERNPRLIAEAVPLVKQSISDFGMNIPITIDKDNVVVCGHTRLRACMELGMDTVPCIRVDQLTEDQVRAFRIVDNKVSEASGWAFDDLDLELGELEGLFDMQSYGFLGEYDYEGDDDGDLEIMEGAGEVTVTEDDPPNVPKRAKCKPGDIILIGRHRLLCGDASDPESVSVLCGNDMADMVFTDPPYNVDMGGKNRFLSENDGRDRIGEDIEGEGDPMDDKKVAETLWEPAFANMRDHAKDECSIYVTMPQGGMHMLCMMNAIHRSGWKVKHELIWMKNNHVLGRADYLYKHEPILFGWNRTHKFYGKGEFNKSIWEIPRPNKSDMHPTMKPLQLIANCIGNSCPPQGTVLDLFGGSGSTLMTCEQTGRTCLMMEISPEYCDVIVKRYIASTEGAEVKIRKPNGKIIAWK